MVGDTGFEPVTSTVWFIWAQFAFDFISKEDLWEDSEKNQWRK
jgi:hypothetical protein